MGPITKLGLFAVPVSGALFSGGPPVRSTIAFGLEIALAARLALRMARTLSLELEVAQNAQWRLQQ